MSKILYISEKEIIDNELLSMDRCIVCIEKMFDLIKKNKYMMGGKTGNSHGSRMKVSTENENNIYLSMSAYLGDGFNKVGFKVHGPNRYISGNNVDTNHLVVLYDNENGRPISIMNGTWLTTLRTAAVSAYATKKLLSEQPKEIGIIGPGRINTEYVKWIVKEFPSIKRIKIKGRSLKSIETFRETVTKETERMIELCIYDSMKEVVKDSDLVSVVTGFEFKSVGEMPFIRDNWIKNGALIICPSFIKFTDGFMKNKTNLVVDNYKMYEEYAEELGRPVYNKLSNLGNALVDLVDREIISEECVYNIYDLECNDRRINKQLPTLFASGGMGTEDVAVASVIFEEAKRRNIGTVLDY